MVDLKAVDIFCGAGGLTRGLLDAGINVVGGYDIANDCKYPYEVNNKVPFHKIDVRDLRSTTLRRVLGKRHPTLVAGCAPCQPFALLGQRAKDHENRQHLLREFSRIVYGLAPTYVTMENVPGLRNRRVFRDFLKVLDHRGYEYDYRIVDARAFGVPQKRRRLVLVASRVGQISVPRPRGESFATVRSAIGSLPPVNAGDSHPSDHVHAASGLIPINLKRIRASKPGGTWHDWPEELQLACHQKPGGADYVNPYGRMEWDKAAPTITTKFFNLGSGRFGHPEQDRALTPREAALLQTFPRAYRFSHESQRLTLPQLGTMIGNAVPVALAKAVGAAVISHARDHFGF